MKTTFSILALATSAAATGFLSAGSFNCPGNSDNKCNPELSSGFDFSDLDFGSFTSYKGFQWQGFTCGSFNSKRSRVDRRTGGKGIGGVCSSDKGKSPSFGYQPGGNDGFSLGSIEVHPEFDCDLEFHYGMGDGSTCKTRSSCSKSGTTVHNNQCAGAHNVTIVYPPQNNKPKPSCTVSVPTMSFSCGSTSTSRARTTSSKPYVATTTSEVKTTKTTEIKSTSTVIKTTTAKTTTAPVETKSTTYKGFQNSTFSTVESSTSAVQTTTSVQSSSSAQSTSYITTSYETTSTVFTTQTKTITSCAETVTNCPAHSTVIVTETIPVTTTVCPVTETRPYTPDTTKSASKPTETLPCPDVVPKCLNTFLFAVSCSDNTDTACYCPNEIFVKSVFDCVFAHGETEEIVSEAIIFVQGLCGAYAPGNPYIIAPTVTSYVTATPTKQPAVYTTITAVVTQTVPCTDASGSIIPSSSSTVTVTETATVPQVGFTTGSSGVGVIPVTTQPQFIPSASAPAVTTTIAAPKSNTTVPSGKPQVTVSGAGRTIGTSFGLGLALAALVAVL